MKILIIGAGNMGTTYGEGIIHANVISKKDLYFLEKSESKGPELKDISHNPLMTEPGPYIQEMDMIILAVKPQDFPSLSAVLRPYLLPSQLVFSIMAGIKVTYIQQHLGVPKVIRAMPNLPAQVRMGMTVFTTSEDVDKKDLFIAQNLLNTTGKAIYTPNETLLDSATAISGSGPAYVFYFMQAMIDTAKEMGFSGYEAQLLVEQTFLGSIHLLQSHDFSCGEWIQKVSSKGGTTEAAVKQFTQDALAQQIARGLKAARQRSEDLSQES